MNRQAQDNIWKKIDTLINNFKRYDLEKRIQYVAKNAVNLGLMASQIQAIKDKVKKKKQTEEYLKKFEEANEKKQAEEKTKKEKTHKLVEEYKEKNKEKHIKESIENIQKTATSAVAAGLMSSQIKKTAIKAIEDDNDDDYDDDFEDESHEDDNYDDDFEDYNDNEYDFESTASQIKETAIQAIENNVEEIKYPDDFHNDDDDDDDNDNDNNFKSTASQIKNTAIQAIKDKVQEELEVEEDIEDLEYGEEKDIQNTATNAVATESTASQIKEASKNAVINGVKIKNVTNNNTKEIFNTALTNVKIKILAKQIIIKFIKKYNSLRRAILAIKKAAIAALTNAVATKYNTELIKQTAIKEVSRPLPKVAESKIDVKNPLIENAAIKKVKDAVKDAVINDLRIKLVEKETIIAENVKRDLEEFAIKTVEKETTGSAKTSPGTSTGPNIENDLKNTAINALYTALLGVPREPVDISKKPDKYDVLITDKTYDYKDGKQTEIPELTKYDRILAKIIE